jgi:hypothetical protein
MWEQHPVRDSVQTPTAAIADRVLLLQNTAPPMWELHPVRDSVQTPPPQSRTGSCSHKYRCSYKTPLLLPTAALALRGPLHFLI